jgi:hypothetical protein
VTALWRQPQTYARFLGQELGLVYDGALLVVMPNGYGGYHLTRAERSVIASLPPPADRLAGATLTAVQRLASASGHRFSVPRASAPATETSADLMAWIVFAVGALVIATAWAASLRARPPQLLGKRPAGH